MERIDLNRRRFIAAALEGTGPTTWAAAAHPARRIGAVALDAFTVLDPRPLAACAESAFPGTGKQLVDVWRTRQFEYAWLRTITASYVDFERVTDDALVYACRSLGLGLSRATARSLTECCWALSAWSDSRDALQRLRSAGIRLAFLSNFRARRLVSAAESNGLDGLLEPPLSTDRVRAFKPHARAYAMGVDAFNLRREQIMFAAFAGWDAAGAAAYGFPTFWVNRMHVPAEELGAAPAAVGEDLHALADFVVASNERHS